MQYCAITIECLKRSIQLRFILKRLENTSGFYKRINTSKWFKLPKAKEIN